MAAPSIVINGAVYYDPTTGITWEGIGGVWVAQAFSAPPTQPGAVATGTILGNISGQTAEPSGLTPAQAKALLAIQASDVAGAVPASATICGHPITGSNLALSYVDVGALSGLAQVNGKALSGNPTLAAQDVGAVPASALGVTVPTLVGGQVPLAQLPTISAVSPMTGATASTSGTGGTTPAPGAGQQNDVLAGAGAFQDSSVNNQIWS
jgi:hypothetical protein